MVAMPPTIKANISDRVIFEIYGLTINGASVWPTKTFAAAAKLSAPDNRITLLITQAIPLTTSWSIPK